jgi:DNA-binding winged helix-turn-helix (wHTH) protein
VVASSRVPTGPRPAVDALLRFDAFELDRRRGVLLREGVTIDLQPKQFDALVLFATSGGRLVTREELHAALWPGVHVADDSLQQVVSKLRRALGDAVREPRFLETVPRRGYRFLPNVEAVPAVESAPPLERVPTGPILGPTDAPAASTNDAPQPADRPAPRPSRAPLILGAVGLAAIAVAVASSRREDSGPPRVERSQRITRSLERKQDPVFAADGTTVVFAMNDAHTGQYDLFAVSVATRDVPRRLTDTADEEFYPRIRGDEILYSRTDGLHHTLWRMPLGGGEPTLAISDAHHGTWTNEGAIVFARSSVDGDAIFVADADADPPRRLAQHTGPVRSLDVDRHSGRIAFADDTQLWILPATGGTPMPVGPPAQNLRSVAWDPLGDALFADPNWNGRANLWWVPLDGAPQPLTTTGGAFHPAIAPDGGAAIYADESKHNLVRHVAHDGTITDVGLPTSAECIDVDARATVLAFTDWEAGTHDGVGVLDLARGPREIVAVGRCPRLSPDGAKIAWLRPDGGLGAMELATRRPIAFDPAVRPMAPPAWSPSGDRLAVWGVLGDASVVAVLPEHGALAAHWPVDDGGAMAWSPDGRSLAIAGRAGTSVLALEDGGLRVLTERRSYEDPPTWIDATTLAVLVDERARPALVEIPLIGAPRDPAPLVLPRDPGTWGVFQARPSPTGWFVVQARYESDLEFLGFAGQRG